jgi:gliding motility-associated protein GldM
MAGGKESPRQKMINMMYLVLTAMLAIQISNAILQKFVVINSSLEGANNAANLSSEKLLKGMNEEIDKKGNKPSDREFYNKAIQVRKITSEIMAYLEKQKSDIVEGPGKGVNKETNQINNLAEEEGVANIFVKNKRGYEVRDKLNKYVSDLEKLIDGKLKFDPIALDAKDDQAMKNTDALTRSKDFAELMFEQTPVPAAMAGISQKQSDIRRYESQALDYLASQVGAKEITFDKIFAVVIPDARAVVAGQKYKAEVAIGAFSSAITPSISINGSGLPVKEGKGLYEITAQGGAYDANGQVKRKYTATVSYPKPDGTRETVTKEEEYTVLKPSVQIMSQSMPPLYFKCKNNIQVSSPGLGALFRPTFSGSGAEFIPGGGGKVAVVPNLAKVSMNVSNEGSVLETFPFSVRRVPKPTIVASVNGSPINENMKKRGIGASSARIINVQAVSDEDFRATNPDDAKFRVSSYDVFIARGTRPKPGNQKGVSGQVNIGAMSSNAEGGDRLLIIVNKVQRQNFKGEIEDVNIGEMSFEVPLN